MLSSRKAWILRENPLPTNHAGSVNNRTEFPAGLCTNTDKDVVDGFCPEPSGSIFATKKIVSGTVVSMRQQPVLLNSKETVVFSFGERGTDSVRCSGNSTSHVALVAVVVVLVVVVVALVVVLVVVAVVLVVVVVLLG